MALKIRLRKQGRRNHPTYRLVVMDGRTKRDGQYEENLGWYQPLAKEDDLHVKVDRVQYWLDQGAELTEKAAALVKRGAPEVAKALQERKIARQAKLTAKRRERRRAKRAV